MMRILKILVITVLVLSVISCKKRNEPDEFPPIDLVNFKVYPTYITGEFAEKLHWIYGDNGIVYSIETTKVSEAKGFVDFSMLSYTEIARVVVNREFYQHYKDGFTIPVAPNSIFWIKVADYSPGMEPNFMHYKTRGNVLVDRIFFPNGACFYQGFLRSDYGFSLSCAGFPGHLFCDSWINFNSNLRYKPQKLHYFSVCYIAPLGESFYCYISGENLNCETYNGLTGERFSFGVTTNVKDFSFALETHLFSSIKFFIVDKDNNLWEYSYWESSPTMFKREFIASNVKYFQLNYLRRGGEQSTMLSYYLFPYFVTGSDMDYLSVYDTQERKVDLLFKEDNVSLILADVSDPEFEVGDERYWLEVSPYRYDLWYVVNGRVLKHNGEVVAEFSTNIVKGAVFRDLTGHFAPILYLLFDNGKFMFWNLSDNPVIMSFRENGKFRKITDFSVIRMFPYRVYFVIEPGVLKLVSVGYEEDYFKAVSGTDVYEFPGMLPFFAFSDSSLTASYIYNPEKKNGHYYYVISGE